MLRFRGALFEKHWPPLNTPCSNRKAFTRRAVNLFSEFFDYILWLTRTHGPIVRVWVGPVLTVLLADPRYIEVSHFFACRTNTSAVSRV